MGLVRKFLKSLRGEGNFKNKRLMIGGHAMKKYGSSRETNFTEYLIDSEETDSAFIQDKANNIGYYNANGSKFYTEIWQMEENNYGQIASPQALLELTVYAFVQPDIYDTFHKLNAETDIKFLVRKFKLKKVTIVDRYITAEYNI